MKISKMNDGNYLPYELNEGILSFGDGACAINLEKEQCGADITIDISIDKDKNIVRGVSDWYAAQVKIPARTFTVFENGIVDEMWLRQIEKTVDPLNIDEVELVLWALEV